MMATKNEQLVRLIESLVKKEVARIAPTIIRETMAQVMGNMILEAADSIGNAPASSPVSANNSAKRKALSENVVGYENDEWPTMNGGISTTATGLRSEPPVNRSGRITVNAAMSTSELGTPTPINQSDIPEYLDNVFNHDYSKLMKTYLRDGTS